jgi:GT2 family glycosyltransferase
LTLTSGTRTTPATVGPDPSWYPVASDAVPVTVINNVGTVIAPDGYAHDRGWLGVDRGQYDTPADVSAWCGAAVLLARAYLDDVGLFDERLFLYYEDVDLSLRGASRGWRYRTAPASVVRHVHAATSVDGSALKDYYNERNRLLVATRHGGRGVEQGPFRVVPRYLAVTASYARRDIVAPLLRGDRPRPTVVRRRLHALGAYTVALPRALHARRLDRLSPPSPAAT